MSLNILNNPAMSGSKKRVESTPLFKSEARKSQIEISKTIQVEMSTIDSICKVYGSIDFLKLDIEGGEMSALKSNNDFERYSGSDQKLLSQKYMIMIKTHLSLKYIIF